MRLHAAVVAAIATALGAWPAVVFEAPAYRTRSATLVIADGRVITASASPTCSSDAECAQMFWALRGGGGGNFGVVTEFSFQMHRVASSMLVGDLCWESDSPLLPQLWDWLMTACVGPNVSTASPL
jgi:hypothetical protein